MFGMLVAGPPSHQRAGQADAIAKAVKPASTLRDRLGEAERNQILKALEQSQWVIAGPKGAAARLGMKRSTLQFRMRKLGIRIARTGA